LADPKNSGRFWGFHGPLWALYGVQILSISANGAIKMSIFPVNQKEAF
jgi:hypothetical protein